MPISGGAGREEMREALRAEQFKTKLFQNWFNPDQVESFKAIGYYLSAYWLNLGETIEDFRREIEGGVEAFGLPGDNVVRFLGKGPFTRELVLGDAPPETVVRFRLALPTMAVGISLDFGIESIATLYWGYIANFELTPTVFRVALYQRGTTKTVDVTASLPADYDTALHIYSIVNTGWGAKFYVGNTLVATIVADYSTSFQTLAYIENLSATNQDIFIRFIELSSQTPLTEKEFFSITSDKDTHFTGAIPQNAKEDENLTDLLTDKVKVKGVMIEADENLHFRLLLWSKGTFDDTDLDLDAYIASVDLDIPTYGFQIGGANQYYLAIEDVDIDYHDEDGTNELHCSLHCVSAAGKSAGAAGEVKVRATYVPSEVF